MKTLRILVVLSIFSVGAINAQNIQKCGTHELFLHNAENNPGYADAVDHTFNYAKTYSQQDHARKAGEGDTIYRIPVVIHIVWNTSDQNLDDSLAHNQIEVLNQDFRRRNADTSDTRTIFKHLAADTRIEFFLADEDPQGNATTGITRTQTPRTNFSLFGGGLGGNAADEVKSSATDGVDAWDVENYLNIWVCNLNDPTFPLGAVLGFAYPPDGAPNWPQDAFPSDPSLGGVVIHYEVFGRNNPNAVGALAIADRGRTTVHEVGHYLGLRHIWGDGPLSFLIPDCSVDDGIDDTPNSGNNSQATGCDTTKNTCSDVGGDLPDMFENYMDYSMESCQNLFTHGQTDIMRAMLATSRMDLPVIVVEGDSTPQVGIFDINLESAIEIYPNPSSGVFTIDFGFVLNEIDQVMMFNALGEQVDFNITESRPSGTKLSIEHHPAGVYLLRIVSGSQAYTNKLLVE